MTACRQHLDGQVALHERGLAEADVGRAVLERGEVLRRSGRSRPARSRVSARPSWSWPRLWMSSAHSPMKAFASGFAVKTASQAAKLDGRSTVVSKSDVVRRPDRGPRRAPRARPASGSRAPGSRGGSCRRWTSPVGRLRRRAARRLPAEDAAALGRSLAHVGRLDARVEQVELHDRDSGVDDRVDGVRPASTPGTEVAMPSTPAFWKPWTRAICPSGSPPSGPATWRVAPRSLAAILAQSAISG